MASRSSTTEHGYRTKLDGWGPKAPPSGFPKFVDHSVGTEEVSMQAMGLVGVPYQWGGNTPTTGFDCSGLVRYVVARAADIILPRTTGQMSKMGVSVSPSEIAPGDLIFFNTDGGRPYSHVGIYVGDYRFVNAPSTGGTVRIDYVTNPYWAKHFDGIRRVAGLNTTPILDTPNTPQQAPSSIMPPRALASVDAAPGSVAESTPNIPVEANTYPQSEQNAPLASGSQPSLAATPLRAGASGPVITDPIALEIARADRDAEVHDVHATWTTASTASTASSYQNHAEAPAAYVRPASAYRPPTPDLPHNVTSGRIVTPPIAASSHDDDPIARLARGY